MSTTVSLLDTPPTTKPDDGFGALSTDQGNLPLEKLDVRIATTGLAVGTELTQVFRNPYAEPLEATYIFPLPDRAAVTSLRMEADARTVEGVLREREQARADYDRAIKEGKRASIAEEERPGVFTMRVGNILPGERVSVRLTLAGRLGYEDGQATVRFPLVVAPRYIPGTPLEDTPVGDGVEPDTDQVPDASRITPPVLLPGFPSPVELSVTAEIDPAGLPLTDVASSLHPIAVEEGEIPPAEGGPLTVRVHPGERADRDFILRLRLGSADAVSSSLVLAPDSGPAAGSDTEKGSAGKNSGSKSSGSKDSGTQEQSGSDSTDLDFGDGTFALTLLPPSLEAKPRARDVVFVLDRSGSMGGAKMVAARRAAARIVDTLTTADRFAVLAFDNKVETPPELPEGLVEATDRNRFRAVEYLTGLQARGGTEMLRPLQQAAGLLGNGTGERERVLVLVTDGQVGNEDQILRDMAERLSDARIHTVGIDVAVNEAFLRRLAILGGGHYELVESEDRLDEAMDAIHRRIGAPLVTDLALAAEGLDVILETVTPTPLPALFAGAAVVVTGRYRGRAGGAVRVTGQAADGSPWSTRLAAAVADAAPAPRDNGARTGPGSLAAVWARSRLRDLEDAYVTARPGRSRKPDLTELERRIVATSLRFGVLCRFTAYVAIDSRVVTEGGVPRRVTQPVDLPQGWDPAALGAPVAQAAAAAGGRGMAGYGGAVPAMAAMAAPAGLPPTPTTESLQRGARAVAHRVGMPSRRPPRPASRRPRFTGVESPALRAAAEEYLPRLRDVGPDDRRDLLREIRERLERLLPELARSGADRLVVRPVEQLVADLIAYERLEAPGSGETERLRLRVVDVLSAFVPDEPGGGATPGASGGEAGPTGRSGERAEPRRRRFWSR